MNKKAVLSKMDWLLIIVGIIFGTTIIVIYIVNKTSGWLPIK